MAGRPSKYNDEILTDTQNYIDNHADFNDVVPSVAGLACALKVNKDTIYEWLKDEEKSQFSDMHKEIIHKQGRMLLTGGLLGDMNPTIAKLMLTKHGYSDKIEQRTETIELSHEQWLETLE